MSRNNRNNQPNGNQPNRNFTPNHPPNKLSCAEILKNNIAEILVQQFLEHAREWPNIDTAPVNDPAAMRDGRFRELWQDVTISVRFDLGFDVKRRLNHPPAAIEDYYPIIHITGSSKRNPNAAQPAAVDGNQGGNQEQQ